MFVDLIARKVAIIVCSLSQIMKIELLRTFVEVGRTLHFRLAAESLFITQSAVSARIKLLEEELGVTLFDRSQRQLCLTPQGNRLMPHANSLIFAWQNAKQDIALAEPGIEQLTIGALTSAWDICLQHWLIAAEKRWSGISLSTITASANDLVKQLLAGSVDLIFLFEPPQISGIEVKAVASVELKLVTTNAVAMAKDAMVANYIYVDYGQSVSVQHAREFGDNTPIKHRIDQPKLALELLLNASSDVLTSAYLPLAMVHQLCQQRRLFMVANAPTFRRDIYAVYAGGSRRRSLIDDALEYVNYVK